MASLAWVILSVLLAFSVSTCLARQCYVVAPNVLRLGVQETVSIAVDGVNSPETIHLFLQDYPGRRHNFSHTTVQLNEEIKTAHIRVTPQDLPELDLLDPSAKIYVSLVVYSDKWFQKEAQLLITPQTGYVYIQTDKPIYTPKHNVKIRIIQLDEDTLPTDYDLTLQIKNPHGISVQSETFTAKKNQNKSGFLAYVFQLPSFPILGIWSVVVLYGHKQELNSTVEFEVREYVLPTFALSLKTPDVILPHYKTVRGSVEAKYVYGKKVKGTAIFTFSVKDQIGNIVTIGSTDSKELEDGGAHFSFSTEMIKNRTDVGWFDGIHGKRLLVEVTVVDDASGKKETAAEDKTIFSVSPYKISFKRCVKDFKPGLIAMILADIRYANDQPASGVRAKISAVNDHNVPMKVQNPFFVSDDEGRVSFSVNTELVGNVQSFTATVQTQDDNYDEKYQAVASVKLTKYVSKTNAYISIARTDGTTPIKPGDRFIGTIYADPPAEIADIFYVVLSRGKIVTSRRLPKGRFKQHQLDITVTSEMIPSIRIVAYAIHKGELVADSVKVEVNKQCRPNTEVSLEESFPLKEPGISGKIIIHGRKDTLVGILAVDEAVYALRNKGLLTKEKMFKRMESHDLGCGPGGGGNTDLVLTNAGVVILTDTTTQTSKKTVIGCEERKRKKREVIDSIANQYEGRARQCCYLGLLSDDFDRSCEERARVVEGYLPDDDVDNCSISFKACCLKKASFSLKSRTDVNNVEDFRARASDILPEDLIDFIDEADDEEIIKNTLERKDFRETWLFEDISIGPNNREEFATTLPHSITTWVIQAVSLSHEFGMCIAVPQKVVVTKKLFIQLNLPYSVIRNEQAEIVATVFNYGINKLPTTVFMYGVKDLCTGFQEGEKSDRKRIYIDPLSAENVVFPVVPLKSGIFDLRVAALSMDGSDVVVRQLYVVPEGETVTKSVNVILDPTNQQKRNKRHIMEEGYSDSIDEAQKLQITSVKLHPEEAYIPGTEACTISAIGSEFGPTVVTSLEDPEKMLLKPIGCGEQNMMFLAPTLYTMHYLKVTDQLTPTAEQKGYNFIRSGYNSELTYRKTDGSFAAFPNRPSSTWLTAFVMKVFCQAKSLVHIDEKVLCSGIDWLIKNQQPQGSFIDNHPVIHRDMMGKVDGKIPMTAFVLISLQECTCEHAQEMLDIAKIRATAFLEEELPTVVEPFQLALVSYALALSDSESAPIANERLRELSIYDEGTNRRYWSGGGSPASIEATSYALLTQLKFNYIEYSNSIVNWLNQQKTPAGSFQSTQDTVLAIQSLSEYSIKSRAPPINLVCNVTSSNDRNFAKTLRFTRDNTLLLQELELKKVGGTLFFTTTGDGIGQLSVKLRYNIPRAPEKICKFEIVVTTDEFKENQNEIHQIQQVAGQFDQRNIIFDMLPEDLIRTMAVRPGNASQVQQAGEDMQPLFQDKARNFGLKVLQTDARNRDLLRFKRDFAEDEAKDPVGSKFVLMLKTCIRYLEDKDAGMTVIDIGIFTGFEPNKNDLKKLIKDDTSLVQRFEQSKKGVVLYLDKTPNDKLHCVQFRIHREYVVRNPQTRTVKVYDYYEPEKSCTIFYDPTKNNPLLKIDCNGQTCRCLEGGCPADEPFAQIARLASNKFNNEAQNLARQTLQQIACETNDYVWKVKVISKRQENGFLYTTFIILDVLKAGIEPRGQLLEMERTFISRDNCGTANLPINKIYIIMGKDGEKIESKDGTISYEYILDKSTSIILWEGVRAAKDKQLHKIFRWLEKNLKTDGCGL